MLATGSSMIEVVKFVETLGASAVRGCAVHGLNVEKDGSAEDKYRDAGVKMLITNSIPRSPEYYAENADCLEVVPLEPTLAKVCHQMMTGGSVSTLYELK